jgi:hypothetical protein
MFATWAWGTYIFFAVFLAAGIVWVWRVLPETKGKTLEEMDRVFKSHSGEEDARMLAEARRDVGLTRESQESAIAAAAYESVFGETKETKVESA